MWYIRLSVFLALIEPHNFHLSAWWNYKNYKMNYKMLFWFTGSSINIPDTFSIKKRRRKRPDSPRGTDFQHLVSN